MEFYNELLAFSNRWGCSVDEAFILVIASFIIFLVLLGWSTGLVFDFGMDLYMVTKKLFIFLRKALRKGMLFLLPKLRRKL